MLAQISIYQESDKFSHYQTNDNDDLNVSIDEISFIFEFLARGLLINILVIIVEIIYKEYF